MSTETVKENFIFESPTYIMRVCKEDGRPTTGDRDFLWPKSGPVEDPNFLDDGQCGAGLHGCRANQILAGMMYLVRADFPIFLICEVEEAEVRDLYGDKCKFPRCNVMYSGTWQGCLTILSGLGLEDVPSEEEFVKKAGWHHPTDGEIARCNSSNFSNSNYKASKEDQHSARWRELQYGDLLHPVTSAERVKVDDLLRKSADSRKTMSGDEAMEYAEIMRRVDASERMTIWAKLQRNLDNLFAVHPYIERLMVATASSNLRIIWPEKESGISLPASAHYWFPEDRYRVRENYVAHVIVMRFKAKAIERAYRKEALVKEKAQNTEIAFYDWRG